MLEKVIETSIAKFLSLLSYKLERGVVGRRMPRIRKKLFHAKDSSASKSSRSSEP